MLPNNKQQTSLLSLNYIFAVGYLTFHKSKVMLLLWLSLESDLKIVAQTSDVMMISFKILVYFRGGSSVVRIFKNKSNFRGGNPPHRNRERGPGNGEVSAGSWGRLPCASLWQLLLSR